jgi:hypothetical protein
MILSLVYECYVDFGPEVDAQQRYTAEYFAKRGKTIEDAEQELGFPRGYTDIGRPDLEPYRWELLRRRSPGCEINEIFEEYLGRTAPCPQPLPALGQVIGDNPRLSYADLTPPLWSPTMRSIITTLFNDDDGDRS